jgi:hypothetical protein
MVSYLSKFPLAKIGVLTNEPDYSDVERSNMIGPSLSMVMYQRLSPGILPLLLEASSH